jgi:hypothetical protein
VFSFGSIKAIFLSRHRLSLVGAKAAVQDKASAAVQDKASEKKYDFLGVLKGENWEKH